MDMLRQWGSTLERACEDIIADVHAGKLLDDTMERHYAYLRHLMGRREIIVNEIMKYDRHKGPGTPGYHELGNRDIERPENSPVDCIDASLDTLRVLQRDGAGRPLGTGNRKSGEADGHVVD